MTQHLFNSFLQAFQTKQHALEESQNIKLQICDMVPLEMVAFLKIWSICKHEAVSCVVLC